MPCTDCASDLNRYSPACLECGGRYLRAIKATRFPLERKQAMLHKALNDWMAMGHAEADLRALAKPKGGK